MSDLCGLHLPHSRADVSKRLQDMFSSLGSPAASNSTLYVEPGLSLGMGLSFLSGGEPEHQPLHSGTSSEMVLISGELYPLRRPLADLPGLIRALRQVDGGFLARLKGNFVIVYVDPFNRVLKLVTDKFGLMPLYYAHVEGGLVFASRIQGLLQIHEVPRRENLEALAEYLRFGFMWGNKTHFRDIQLVPPGSVLTYDLTSGNLNLHEYWSLESLFVKNGRYREDVDKDEIAEAFIKAVETRVSPGTDVAVSLSGGMDSRAILAALRFGGHQCRTHTLGIQGSTDQRLAARISGVAGVPHDFVPLNQMLESSFRSIAEDILFYSDGMYAPSELTEKAALDYLATSRPGLLFRGHGGEALKTKTIYPMGLKQAMLQSSGNCLHSYLKLFDSYNAMTLNGSLLSSEMLAAQDKSLNTIMAAYETDFFNALANADKMIYIFLKEYIRRQCVASLSIFRSLSEVQVPFLDEDLLHTALSMHHKYRFSTSIHCKIIKKCMSELLDIPDGNTGSLPDSGFATHFIYDKANTIFQKLNLFGYRHYTQYHKWQKENFKDDIQNLLFDPRTQNRKLFNQNGVKKIYLGHVQGKANYANLLSHFLGIEIWYRNFMEKV